MPLGQDELKRRFEHHPPLNVDVAELHDLVRGDVSELANRLNQELPDCREKSLAMTKLEEVLFWSNAAIAREMDDPTGA